MENATENDRKVLYWMGGFIAQHTIMSHPPIRKRLVNGVGGDRNFFGIYSILSCATFIPSMYYFIKYTRHQKDSPLLPFIKNNKSLYKSIGLILISIGAFVSPYTFIDLKPIVTKQERVNEKSNYAKSITGYKRITRHPEFWYFILFFSGQVLNNGSYSYSYFYIPLCMECVIGMIHQDWRQKQWLNESGDNSKWFKNTSLIPFVAIFQGKHSIMDAINEIGVLKLGLGAIASYSAYRYWK